MERTARPARERIVLAAVDILEKEGAEGITTRRIAALAGVNSASVNYYFGSREKLVEHVMAITLEHGFADWAVILGREQIPLPLRLFSVIMLMIEGIERYPGIVRSHLLAATSAGSSDRFLEAFEGFLDKAASAVAGPSRKTFQESRLAVGQMLASAMLAALVPGLLGSLAGSREEFAANLVGMFSGRRPRLTPSALATVSALRAEAFESFEGR